jgi:2-oxoglutarate ferredoxin oxidoreductase subunit alpha
LPTKTEQSDLFQAMAAAMVNARMPIIAAQSPSDCFYACYEAFPDRGQIYDSGHRADRRLPRQRFRAVAGSQSRRPSRDQGQPRHQARKGFQPYARDENLSRPWALPGTKGLAHRIGGLEKENITGKVSYDPMNHEFMVKLRAAKNAKVADMLPDQQVLGPQSGDLLVVSWGGTYGSVRTAVERKQAQGASVSHMHLRHISPMPRNLPEIFPRFKKVLVPELNLGPAAHAAEGDLSGGRQGAQQGSRPAVHCG